MRRPLSSRWCWTVEVDRSRGPHSREPQISILDNLQGHFTEGRRANSGVVAAYVSHSSGRDRRYAWSKSAARWGDETDAWPRPPFCDEIGAAPPARRPRPPPTATATGAAWQASRQAGRQAAVRKLQRERRRRRRPDVTRNLALLLI